MIREHKAPKAQQMGSCAHKEQVSAQPGRNVGREGTPTIKLERKKVIRVLVW